MFSNEYLPSVCPSPDIDVFSFDLIGDVEKHDVEVVVGLVIRLEQNFDNVVRVWFDCS